MAGSADGTGSAARFSSPSGVAVACVGDIFVADTDNNRISKGSPPGPLVWILQPEIVGLHLLTNFHAVLTGLPGKGNVVIEFSTNLSRWQPIETNRITDCSMPLSITIGPRDRIGFYRTAIRD